MNRPNRILCDPLAVTVGQAAKLLGVSRWTIWKDLSEGRLKKNRYGKLSVKQLERAAQERNK